MSRYQKTVATRTLVLLGACLYVVLAPASTLAAAPAQERGTIVQDPNYRIGPRDVIRVSVFDMDEMETQATVSETGTIRMPLVGDIRAAGLTTRELEESIADALARYVTDPQVTVEVEQFQSQTFFLYGAVRNVGSYPISGELSLLEALVSAGGILEEEAAGGIKIIRDSFGREPLEIDGRELFFEGNRAYDIQIESGDMINVVTKPEYNVYIYDEGGDGGAYTFRDPVSLLQAISLVGGLGEGAKDEVTIVRTQPDGNKVQLKVNFKDILEGEIEDVALSPGDVVIVRRGGFFG
ncbi:MAG: hypothetical protein GKS06_04150 [Acidobacteria bacterium]|nr:hypothetical protein [Acidobacteriota bacterium]